MKKYIKSFSREYFLQMWLEINARKTEKLDILQMSKK